MRVLMCGNHSSNKGGMSTVISQIVQYDWNTDKVELRFIPTYMDGSKIRTILYFVMALFRVSIYLFLKKPDVIYTHMSVRGSFYRTKMLLVLSKIFKVRMVIHLHGSEFADWFASLSKKKQMEVSHVIEESYAFIVLGSKWENYIKKIAPKANVKILHNCVKVPALHVDWNDGIINILYLGVLIPRKGVYDLLKAIQIIVYEKEKKNYRLLIAGTGPEEENLKRFVRENSLDDYVQFLGWIDENRKESLFKKSSLLVLPSYNEGLPMVILEAMSYGIPIVSTNVGDVEDVISEGENGYLFSPGDFEKMAELIQSALEKDNWSKMSNRNFSLIQTYYNISNYYKELLSIWK